MIMLKPSLPHSRWSIPGMAMLAVIALATLLLMPGFSSAQNPEPELFDYVPESTELLLYVDSKAAMENSYIKQSFALEQIRARVPTSLPLDDLPLDIIANFKLLACLERSVPNTNNFDSGIILLQSSSSWSEIKQLLSQRFPEKIQSREVDGHEVLEFSYAGRDNPIVVRMSRLNDHLFVLHPPAYWPSHPQPRAAGVTPKILERATLIPENALAYLTASVDLGSAIAAQSIQGLPSIYLVEETPERLNCTVAFQVAPDQMETVGELFHKMIQQNSFFSVSTDVAHHTQFLTWMVTPESFRLFLSQFNAPKPATP